MKPCFTPSMVPTFLLGGDLPINRLGYGAMRLCAQPGNFGPYPDWEGGKALLRRAVGLGVNFIDTAHPYGPGFNEELIADALSPYAGGVIITTKGGVAHGEAGAQRCQSHGPPARPGTIPCVTDRRNRSQVMPRSKLHRC